MAEFTLQIRNKDGKILVESAKDREVTLVFEQAYTEGDQIVLRVEKENCFLWIQFEDTMESAFVYVRKKEIFFAIPFGEKRVSYSPKSFVGDCHWLHVREARDYEIAAYKNLAKNAFDQHGDPGIYPHASANVETRGEAVFAARNAIDGVVETHSHGNWPFESWGINRREDACMRIAFGRTVLIDRMILYTRADYPHDNWWEKVTFTFSDGSELTTDLIKTGEAQEILFPQKKVGWITLSNLVKADVPSPFPALTQWEVFGREADCDYSS